MNAPLFPIPAAASRPLRSYQADAIERLRASLKDGHKAALLQLPTAAGKTRIAAEVIRFALSKSNEVVFAVPRLDLVNQAIRDFEREGIDHIGVIQGMHHRTDPTAPVQVASVQTLARRAARPKAKIVIVDEAHLQNKHISKWIAEAKGTTFIGLSATPWSKGLGLIYDDLLLPTSVKELQEAGYLSPAIVLAPPGPDLSGVGTVAGEFKEDDLSEAVNKTALVANIVETWRAKGENRPTLCYGVDRKHAQHLQERFIEAGIPTEYIDCFTKISEREEIFTRFRSGETKIITNVATLDTGVDLDVRCIIDARPTKSRIKFVQTIGRGLRLANGKDHCLVLDHAGNHHRLGRVEDIHCDKLDMGEPGKAYDKSKAEKTKELKTCKRCYCVLPPGARVCPSCGEKILAATSIIEGEGELVELGSGKKGRKAKVDYQQWIGGLRRIARERGYKLNWASHLYKEKFGFWPGRDFFECEPTIEIRNWVKSRTIAFAKGRSRG